MDKIKLAIKANFLFTNSVKYDIIYIEVRVMEILSKLIVSLIAAYAGWHIGKYIVITHIIRKQIKEEK